ncbi:hypothetical protein [Acaryochloris sp. CCMEE 5410]|nr:hypothetical protein [Acaryochloris sp. CCMEE 5410]
MGCCCDWQQQIVQAVQPLQINDVLLSRHIAVRPLEPLRLLLKRG